MESDVDSEELNRLDQMEAAERAEEMGAFDFNKASNHNRALFEF